MVVLICIYRSISVTAAITGLHSVQGEHLHDVILVCDINYIISAGRLCHNCVRLYRLNVLNTVVYCELSKEIIRGSFHSGLFFLLRLLDSKLCEEIILNSRCRFGFFLRHLNSKLSEAVVHRHACTGDILSCGKSLPLCLLGGESCSFLLGSSLCFLLSSLSCCLSGLLSLRSFSFCNGFFCFLSRIFCDFGCCISQRNDAVIDNSSLCAKFFLFDESVHFFFIGSDYFFCKDSFALFAGYILEVGHST